MFSKNSIYKLVFINIAFFLYCIFFISGKTSEKEYKLSYPSYFGPKAQHSSDTLQKAIVELGRFLFYDKRLSGNNTVSCGSCHMQKYAFSDNRKLSLGEGGTTTRNSMSLTNLAWHDKFFWDGRARTLEDQVLIPIQNKIEMNQNLDSLIPELKRIPLYAKLFTKAYGNDEITSKKIGRAIVQFENTLISHNSKFDLFLSGDTMVLNEQEQKGYKLFLTMPNPAKAIRGAGCASCHKTPFFLSYNYQNNGLDSVYNDKGLEVLTNNPLEHGKFKVPMLRNIALTAPYMHDGRFNDLKEVLNHYNSNIKQSHTLASFLKGISNDKNGKTLGLTSEEIEALIVFLNTLTDQKLTKKKEYSDPFTESKHSY